MGKSLFGDHPPLVAEMGNCAFSNLRQNPLIEFKWIAFWRREAGFASKTRLQLAPQIILGIRARQETGAGDHQKLEARHVQQDIRSASHQKRFESLAARSTNP